MVIITVMRGVHSPTVMRGVVCNLYAAHASAEYSMISLLIASAKVPNEPVMVSISRVCCRKAGRCDRSSLPSLHPVLGRSHRGGGMHDRFTDVWGNDVEIGSFD